MTVMDMVKANMGSWIEIGVFFVIVALVVGLASKFLDGGDKKRRYRRRPDRRSFASGFKPVPFQGAGDQRAVDSADQLRSVMAADFKARPVFNRGELRLYRVLEEALAMESPGWRAMGQVSLGEILTSPNKSAFFSVNSKRVDLLIVDAESNPLHAVEFQGTGHHRARNTAARDAVKKEALRRAGIGYIEVVSGDTPAEVREMVRKLVARVEA
ncbi:DUF2726 domain-containing protein [Erythrobacter sp.]|uniref:DUF2726 domain-containing protein n=1 Tax=Erythrobacter sp. TaxID=1042 RepID=UPI00311E9018